MKDIIETVEYASMLYDFYGSLLSDSQSEIMALYHEDNLSLSEIAEQIGQSRQAVHYKLKRAEKALETFEEKLRLVESYHARQKQAARLAEIISDSDLPKGEKAEAAKLIELISE